MSDDIHRIDKELVAMSGQINTLEASLAAVLEGFRKDLEGFRKDMESFRKDMAYQGTEAARRETRLLLAIAAIAALGFTGLGLLIRWPG